MIFDSSLTTSTVVIIAVLLALIIYIILIYNNLISLKNNVAKNWANIDVLLKQRNSEIPKLIDTCKEYMQFEQDTLQKIVRAREATISASSTNNIPALGMAETDLHQGLLKLFALAENYPDLKTNNSFLQLQSRISDLENSIADRREFYNDSVNQNNIRIQQFPDVLVAKSFNFKAYDLLKFSKDEIQDVDVKDMFKR
jgi:LemA protein